MKTAALILALMTSQQEMPKDIVPDLCHDLSLTLYTVVKWAVVCPKGEVRITLPPKPFAVECAGGRQPLAPIPRTNKLFPKRAPTISPDLAPYGG